MFSHSISSLWHYAGLLVFFLLVSFISLVLSYLSYILPEIQSDPGLQTIWLFHKHYFKIRLNMIIGVLPARPTLVFVVLVGHRPKPSCDDLVGFWPSESLVSYDGTRLTVGHMNRSLTRDNIHPVLAETTSPAWWPYHRHALPPGEKLDHSFVRKITVATLIDDHERRSKLLRFTPSGHLGHGEYRKTHCEDSRRR